MDQSRSLPRPRPLRRRVHPARRRRPRRVGEARPRRARRHRRPKRGRDSPRRRPKRRGIARVLGRRGFFVTPRRRLRRLRYAPRHQTRLAQGGTQRALDAVSTGADVASPTARARR